MVIFEKLQKYGLLLFWKETLKNIIFQNYVSRTVIYENNMQGLELRFIISVINSVTYNNISYY